MVEALKQSFMDQFSCTSPLPRIWVIETLARSNQIDIPLLLDLLEKTPEVYHDLGRNAREFVSLRILESLFVQGARANLVTSTSGQKIRLEPFDDSCEDVLRRILTEISPSHLRPPFPEMSRWDLQPFIEYKRSSLAGYALQQLKNAMLTGSHSFLVSLKERSRLLDVSQPDRRTSVDNGNCIGITPRLEGSATSDGDLLERDMPDQNVVPVSRKRAATTTSENAGDGTRENLIPLKNGCEAHIKSVKKCKHDIICSEQNVGEKLMFSSIDVQLADMSTDSLQHSEEKGCILGTKSCVGDSELNGTPKDDKCTSSEGLVGPDEVLPCENQVPCDTEVIKKSDVEQEQESQDHGIEGAKDDKEYLCDLTGTEDVNKFEQNIQRNVGEVEEVDISSDTDVNYEDNGLLSCNHVHDHDSFTATSCRDQNLSVDTSTRYSEEERCSLGKKTNVEVMGQHESPGDGNYICTSLKVLVDHDEVSMHAKKARHFSPCQNENSDWEETQDHDGENAGDKNCLHGLSTANADMDKLQQNVSRNVQNVGEAEEDVDISTDIDGYHDEKTNIDTKKRTFLSSQCTYSQDSLATTDWRGLNLCVKCNLGGKLLGCGSDSCPLVIHQRCLGLDELFDMTVEFYCPFCAYSRAISNYMDIKKKAALARKDLATFICLETERGSKKPSQRLCNMNQNHLGQDDGLRNNNDLNRRDAKKGCDRQRRTRLQFEQAGPSEYSPPFGKKTVDSIGQVAHTMNKDKQEVERTKQVSQSPKTRGKNQMAAVGICKSQGKLTSGQVLKRSGRSVNHDSNKGILCPPETDLLCETKSSQSSESADADEISEEENDNSGVSKYFIRVRKQEKRRSYPAIPQLRRKRRPWTTEEEDKLKEGIGIHCSPHDKIIPWKKILEHGAGTFHRSRSTMDLKDKWRNMCKSTPKSE
ncbi:hypothetical protein OROGR_022854 [Orobanche gracilis]